MATVRHHVDSRALAYLDGALAYVDGAGALAHMDGAGALAHIN